MLISMIFDFKQKTAYEMRISDWSSDVCSSDLALDALAKLDAREAGDRDRRAGVLGRRLEHLGDLGLAVDDVDLLQQHDLLVELAQAALDHLGDDVLGLRSEEHTSELQSLMRISYAVLCLKKTNQHNMQSIK